MLHGVLKATLGASPLVSACGPKDPKGSRAALLLTKSQTEDDKWTKSFGSEQMA